MMTCDIYSWAHLGLGMGMGMGCAACAAAAAALCTSFHRSRVTSLFPRQTSSEESAARSEHATCNMMQEEFSLHALVERKMAPN